MKKQSLRKVLAVTAVVAVLSLSAPLGAEARPLKPDAIGEFSGIGVAPLSWTVLRLGFKR